MWETHGLMTRINKAKVTTICNRGLCSTVEKTEERFDMAWGPRFLNGDVVQMVERSLSMREVRRSMPRISNFSEQPGTQKKTTGSYLVRPKEDLDFYLQYAKRSIWNSTELAEKAIGAPNHHGLPQKVVDGNITPAISESKSSLWHKLLLWTPPARHVNRKGKRLACEKHMDWWLASTKPNLQRYAIEDSVQLLKKQMKGLILH